MNQLQPFKKPVLSLTLLLLSFFCCSQVTEQWVKRYNGLGDANDNPAKLVVDDSGNVYVTGWSTGSGTASDYATIKYDAAGNELWVRQYSSPGNNSDAATSIVLDATGNVYVTGGSGFDYATIKYDAGGNQLWVKQYSNGAATSLAVDDSGNVYVTGVISAGGEVASYATIKYDAAGTELWVRIHGLTDNNGFNNPSLALDGFGNVYVTGNSYNAFTTIKYDAAGNEVWVKQDGIGSGDAIIVDSSGNVYVTDVVTTIKYDSTGKQLWLKNYNDGAYGDFPADLALDGFGNVYVLTNAEDTAFNLDYVTIKYDSAGNELWVKRYNSPDNGWDTPYELAVDSSGNVYVTGVDATIKYDAAGNELWVEGGGTSLGVDASGNVYTTGSFYNGEATSDYTTIKYSQIQAASVVASFSLINADNDKEVRELKEGDTINLATLPSLKLNIRANTDPATVGSVVFKLSGAEMRSHTENIVPYALFADNNKGDYYPWIPTNGSYTLTATPYSGTKGSGTKGTSLAIHFIITGQVVSNLILVNAETDTDIKTLEDGDVIDLSTLPTTKLNIRALVHPDTVGSVVFNLNNRLIVRENLMPYAIGGDIKGNFRAWTLPTGKHVLAATPYALKYGRGKRGKGHTLLFTVVEKAAMTQAANQRNSLIDAQDAAASLSTTPNPFTVQTTVRFSVPKSGYTTVQVYDMTGTVVGRLYQGWVEGGKAYQIIFDSKQLPAGLYIVNIATGKQVQSTRLVLVR